MSSIIPTLSLQSYIIDSAEESDIDPNIDDSTIPVILTFRGKTA
jgi:hypothetical protein